MDITLKRIFSLMEHKENGNIARGGKARFARSIGYDSGDIVSMWENGSSKSYLKKLHEIAAKYDVSVEWLKGETDDMGGTGLYQGKGQSALAGAAGVAAGIAGSVLLPGAAAIAVIDTAGATLLSGKKKKPAPTNGDGMDDITKELIDFWETSNEDERRALMEMARFIRKQRGK